MRGTVMEELQSDLKRAVITADQPLAIDAARRVVAQGGDLLAAVEQGLSAGMAVVGEDFERGECFLPELVSAAETFGVAMTVLEPEIEKAGGILKRSGVAVVGTVAGDVHSIGKDIFAMLLKVRGFQVHDLGVDVSMGDFVEKADELGADMIGMSALLTTTMPSQREVIDTLCELGVRDKYVIMVGGGPVFQPWAEQIGADGYADTAQQGAELAVRLVAEKRAITSSFEPPRGSS
jgi:corrinoid protein of di/trimethylamine methyltransferase